MRLAIVVGHNREAQGAVRKDTGESEFVWNGGFACRIKDLSNAYGIEVCIFYRNPESRYQDEIARVYETVDLWGADGSLELHFNSAASETATGTETLTSGTPLSLRLAGSVHREMVGVLGLRDRGILVRTPQDRGGTSLHAGRAPAVLLEPFFGSTDGDLQAIDSDAEQDRLARAILRGAVEAFKGFPRTNLSESRTLQATSEQRRANRTSARSQVAAGVAAAASGAREQIAQVPAVGVLADWLPYVTVGLIIVALIATAVSHAKADTIDEARLDDHEKAVR